MSSIRFRVSGVSDENYRERGIAALNFLKTEGNPKDRFFDPSHSHKVQVRISGFEKDPDAAIGVARMWFEDGIGCAGAQAGRADVEFSLVE